MTRRRKAALAAATAGALALTGCTWLAWQWHIGTPYGEPLWIPAHTHYLQRHKPPAWSMPVLPGQGSDHLPGSFTLHARDGRLLRRSRSLNLAEVEHRWAAGELYFLGADDPGWPLPPPAQGRP